MRHLLFLSTSIIAPFHLPANRDESRTDDDSSLNDPNVCSWLEVQATFSTPYVSHKPYTKYFLSSQQGVLVKEKALHLKIISYGFTYTYWWEMPNPTYRCM
ncbi:hypothetical protein GGS26DRAFT_558127 [Hypomontagnella submonticulosa]|nr:hypothetical protein GGS26DRAFT_558127 [Hypomontagnella submonticulosa]